MKDQVRQFIDGVRNIPLLSDESFRNGGYSGLDDRSALHFLIYPFVGALGYSIFRPDELKLGYEVEGNVADLALFDRGSVLASFRILSLGEFPRLGDLVGDELDRMLVELTGTGSVLSVLTNGLDYRVFVEDAGSFEELIHFNLFDVMGDEVVGVRVSGLLMKSEIVTDVGVRRLFEEKVMLSKLEGEHFLSSRFMVEVLRQELSEVSDSLLKVLVGRLAKTFGVSVGESELFDRVGAVVMENGGSLERTLETLLSDRVVESWGWDVVGEVEVREVEREVVRELTEVEKELLVSERVEAILAEAERGQVERLEKDIRSLLDEEYALRVSMLEESIEERVEARVAELVEERVALRLAESKTDREEPIEEVSTEATSEEVEVVEKVEDVESTEDVGSTESVESGTGSIGVDLTSILSKFETVEDVGKSEEFGTSDKVGTGEMEIQVEGRGDVSDLGYDAWTRPDYGVEDTRGERVDESKDDFVASAEETFEEKPEDNPEDKKASGSLGGMDLNSLLGI